MGYATSPFRDFESYLRNKVGPDENDIQLVSKQNNSFYITIVTYELSSVIYTNKDLQEAVHPLGDHEGTLKIENDDIVMKKKLKETRFDGTFGTLRFIEKPFSRTLLL